MKEGGREGGREGDSVRSILTLSSCWSCERRRRMQQTTNEQNVKYILSGSGVEASNE